MRYRLGEFVFGAFNLIGFCSERISWRLLFGVLPAILSRSQSVAFRGHFHPGSRVLGRPFAAQNTQLTQTTSPMESSSVSLPSGGGNSEATMQFSSVLLEHDEETELKRKTALIVLNSPMQNPPSPLFAQLWERSSFHACADGGANRLYQATIAGNSPGGSNGGPTTTNRIQEQYIPNLIRGDLDSLWDHVQEHYASLGTTIEHDPCQDTNDLDKVLQVCQTEKVSRVLIYGAFGGRFDQEMASLQALYNWGPTFAFQVFLYTDETFAFLVPAATQCEIQMPFYDNHISPPKQRHQEQDGANSLPVVGEGPTCGLIPLGCKCDSIVTNGLKWDLDGNTPMEFGGLVSTSNRIMKAVVTVKSSHPVVFTAEISSSTQ
jgi:thiamine pyrophosphokinase